MNSSINGGSGGGDHNDSASGRIRTSVGKINAHHEKDHDPFLLWRDFGGDNTNINAKTRRSRQNESSFYGEEDEEEGMDWNYHSDHSNHFHEKQTGTKECKDDNSSGYPSDEKDIGSNEKNCSFSYWKDIGEQVAAENTKQNGPTTTNTSTATTTTTATSSSPNRNPTVPIFLEKGWKGVAVASFVASCGTSTPTSRSSMVLDETSESASSKSDNYPLAAPSIASETRSFPSDGAWVLGSDNDDDNDDDDVDMIHGQSPSWRNRYGRNKNPVYAALVLDSMLRPESGNEVENYNVKKEEDSLMWTWAGGDKTDEFRYSRSSSTIPKLPPPPLPPLPTQEIAFDVSWEDALEDEKEDTNKGNFDSDDEDDGRFSVPSFGEEYDEMPTFENDPTNNTHDDNTTAQDGRSLSLLAACTYSMVFGLDYFEDGHKNSRSNDDEEENDGEEEKDDWCVIEPPIRSVIPNGDSIGTSVSKSDSNSNSENDSSVEEKRSKRCLWITIALGIFLFSVITFVVFFFAIETIHVSGRR